MRTLFLIACVLIGVFAGLWWSELTPADLHLKKLSALRDDNTVQVIDPVPVDITNNPPSNAKDQPVPLANKPGRLRPFSYNEGIKRVAPAVVSVYASDPAFDLNPGSTSQGSGVIVDTDGIILTNLHLIEDYRSIAVVLSDGRRYAATLIGSDSETDLAVVQIDANMLPSTKLNEAAPLQVGDIVLAIGNPFGVGQTVTQGIVSATRRRVANGTVWQNFIQIDAAINPGNSGGALINPLGELVGVNTAVFRGDSGAVGIGFAIPSDLLAQVVPQIIENGSVSRGWLGLGVDDVNMFPMLFAQTQQGAVITSVQENGPADLAGVNPMDVVIQLGEQNIVDATQLLLAVSALPPGATVKLALLRSPNAQPDEATLSNEPMQPLMLKVKLGIRPSIGRTQPHQGG